MNPIEIAMLAGGVVLFVVAIGLVVFCVVKRRSYKALFVLFPLAIIMIGFPSINSFKVLGAEVNLQKSIKEFQEHPDDPTARASLDDALNKREDSAKAITPETHSNLLAAVHELNQHSNLSPESRITLSRAQLVLGLTNAAVTNLHFALKQKTNLVINPRLRVLMKPISH